MSGAPLNLTPLRVKVLRFLADKPDGYAAKGLVQECMPRKTRTGAWTEQGAARMAGKLVKPLREAGLIHDTQAIMYCRNVKITEAGRERLRQLELAAAHAREIESAAIVGAVDASAPRYFSGILNRMVP